MACIVPAMFLFNPETKEWLASDSIPNFPTRESFLSIYDGSNVRTPDMASDDYGEVEDTEAQDELLLANRINNFKKYYSTGLFTTGFAK